jgi:hypothetical protein
MITAIRTTLDTASRNPAHKPAVTAQQPAASQALVTVAPIAARDVTPRALPRASAAFVAQLIATHAGHAQTRSRNRVAPNEAIAAYDDVVRRLRVVGR